MKTPSRFRTRPLAAALVAGLGLGVHAAGACAATQIAVTTTDDAGSAATCTLRQAITAMNNGGVTTGSACVASTISGVDTIVFDTTTFPPHGANTITLADAANNQLSITDANLVIDASANDNVTVQRAATATNAFGIFYDIAYGTLTIDSLTIANGKLGAAQPSGYAFGAGITCVCSNLTLRNSTVMDNAIATSVYAAGGGVFVYTGDLTMTGSTVSGNSAQMLLPKAKCTAARASTTCSLLWARVKRSPARNAPRKCSRSGSAARAGRFHHSSAATTKT